MLGEAKPLFGIAAQILGGHIEILRTDCFTILEKMGWIQSQKDFLGLKLSIR